MGEMAATAASGMKMQCLRVLFLPKNSRMAWFGSFLGEAVAQCGWHIHVACPQSSVKFWKGKAGPQSAFSHVPEFSQRQPWESDEKTVAALDAFIADCEWASGVSCGRIVLAGERDLGRGLSRSSYYWFRNRIAKSVLADTSQPFLILRRVFAFARDTLQAAKPELVLAGEWADPMCFVFQLVARQLGIPCVVNRNSKVWSGRCYWSAEPSMYNHEARLLTARLRKQDIVPSKQAQERIAAFKNSPKTLGYVQQNWDRSERRGWFARHLDIARLLGVQILHALGRRSGPEPKPALQIAVEHYRQPWLEWRQSRFFRRLSEEALRETRYLFIALHKDPEQALNYQAPFWSNQYNTVALLSGALPAGYSLLVREHRMNNGRRPTSYYREMTRLPGVILIDAFDCQFKYIDNADLVVTDNGSTGWEGLMLGRRVLTLDDTFYDAAELGRRIRQPENLAIEVTELLQHPAVRNTAAHDRALGWLMDAEWETTAPLDEDGHAEAISLLADVLDTSDRSSVRKESMPA